MCGITGFITVEPTSTQISVLERMTDSIRHRGPDDSGFYEDQHAFLGHRRLSIVDLSGGHQPMTNEDETLWITYNGEIFNHRDLRQELEGLGHRYSTRCDTESILHAFEQHGPGCLARLRGMFAFAIWDKRARRLFCARDRLGKKPFYYFWDGRVFVFGSEIKSLMRHPAISPRIEETILPEYLAFGYLSDERTFFAGIRRLMPGHSLTLDLDALAPQPVIQQYWDLPFPASDDDRDQGYWIHECRQRLEESVRLRLMSDVPLGLFLSGGLDSSAIAAIMSRLVPQRVQTFAVGYPEESYSELSYAARVARHIGTDHREVVVGMEDFFNALPMVIWHEDEPAAWPSSVPLYFVSRLAAEHVTVALTGEGSDELFAGYARYRMHALNQRWFHLYRICPASLRRVFRTRLASNRLIGADLRRKLQHTVLGREDTLESLYLENFYGAFSAEERAVSFPSLEGEPPYQNFRRYWNSPGARSPLGQILYADQRTYLVELLMKQDQMSMSASIETRVPFLDHTFVEFSARVPDHLKLRGGQGKYILKKALEDLLPHDILYRKKRGFPTPLRQWLLDPRAAPLYAALRDRDGLLASYVDSHALEALIDRHQRGVDDATDRLWRLLNLQLWGDLFLTGKREPIAEAFWPAGSIA